MSVSTLGCDCHVLVFRREMLQDIQQPQIPPNAPSQVYAIPNDYDQIGSPPSAEPVHDAIAALEDIAVAHLSANTKVDGSDAVFGHFSRRRCVPKNMARL